MKSQNTMATWDSQTYSSNLHLKCVKERLVTSWKPSNPKSRNAGSDKTHFSLLCDCVGWNAMLPAVMLKRSTVTSWCFELRLQDSNGWPPPGQNETSEEEDGFFSLGFSNDTSGPPV